MLKRLYFRESSVDESVEFIRHYPVSCHPLESVFTKGQPWGSFDGFYPIQANNVVLFRRLSDMYVPKARSLHPTSWFTCFSKNVSKLQFGLLNELSLTVSIVKNIFKFGRSTVLSVADEFKWFFFWSVKCLLFSELTVSSLSCRRLIEHFAERTKSWFFGLETRLLSTFDIHKLTSKLNESLVHK